TLPPAVIAFPTRRSSDLACSRCCAAGWWPGPASRATIEHPLHDLDRVAAHAVGAGTEECLHAQLVDGEALEARPHRELLVGVARSEEHTSELQSRENLVC